jgi:hypothetical protein
VCVWLDVWGGEDSIQSSFIDAVDWPLDEPQTQQQMAAGRKPIQATDPWNMSHPKTKKVKVPNKTIG